MDISEAYKKVVDSMSNYSSVKVNVGSFHLTKPKELGDKQLAVLNTKGILLFAKPCQNLTTDQWRQLFTGLQVEP